MHSLKKKGWEHPVSLSHSVRTKAAERWKKRKEHCLFSVKWGWGALCQRAKIQIWIQKEKLCIAKITRTITAAFKRRYVKGRRERPLQRTKSVTFTLKLVSESSGGYRKCKILISECFLEVPKIPSAAPHHRGYTETPGCHTPLTEMLQLNRNIRGKKQMSFNLNLEVYWVLQYKQYFTQLQGLSSLAPQCYFLLHW